MLPRQTAGEACEILKAIGAGEDVDGDGLLNGLARVSRLEVRELGVGGAKQVRGPTQDPPPLGARHGRPDLLPGGRGGDGGVHGGGVRDLHLGQHLARRRICGGEALPRSVDKAAADIAAPERRSGGFRWLGRHGGEAAVDKGGQHRPSAFAVGFAPGGQGRAQPHPVDHGGDHGGETPRVRLRQQLAKGVAQIGQHAFLIDELHPAQAIVVQHLPPEGEPGRAGPLVELARIKIGVDHCLDPRPRTVRHLQSHGDRFAQP